MHCVVLDRIGHHRGCVNLRELRSVIIQKRKHCKKPKQQFFGQVFFFYKELFFFCEAKLF